MSKVAAIQMTSSNVRDDNLATARGLLEQAAHAGARVAVLPENFSIMAQRDAERRAVAEVDGEGPVQDFLANTASRLGLWIVAGTTPLILANEARLATSCLVYDDKGQRVARYDKMHLFDVELPDKNESYRESAHFAPGRTPVVVDTPAGKLGLSVCYDMRFPELYRQLVAAGAEWLSMPAAFTVPTGQAHWEILLRARAVENLCHVVAAPGATVWLSTTGARLSPSCRRAPALSLPILIWLRNAKRGGHFRRCRIAYCSKGISR
jgi:nitrilase